MLHRPAQRVEVFDDALAQLVADMMETTTAAHGVGLAAPQIGVGLRIFVWDMANDDGVPRRGVLINPMLKLARLRDGAPDPDTESEGCLSVPGENFPLRRSERAEVFGYDVTGEPVNFVATGWFARCMQHETDHLNGMLYVDRLDAKWSRKAKKAIRKAGWGTPGHSWMPGVDADPFGHDDTADPLGHDHTAD